MTKKFECFIKFKDCKFDIVLRDQKLPEEKVNNVPITYIRFNIIYIKMAQIFQIALRTELDTVRYLFEVSFSLPKLYRGLTVLLIDSLPTRHSPKPTS